MAQWVIPVTVPVWVEADTLEEAKKELRFKPPFIDVLAGFVNYVSAPVGELGRAKAVKKRPVWANQR